jgi:hypothetical protein
MNSAARIAFVTRANRGLGREIARQIFFGILILGSLCVHPAFASPDHMSEAELRQKYRTPESKFMDLDGVRFHFYDQGNGPAIVFIHGEMENLHAWDGVAALLVNQFRVVRFDVPDCGLSGPDPKRRYDFEGYADLLGRFVDRRIVLGRFGRLYLCRRPSGPRGGPGAHQHARRPRRQQIILCRGIECHRLQWGC